VRGIQDSHRTCCWRQILSKARKIVSECKFLADRADTFAARKFRSPSQACSISSHQKPRSQPHRLWLGQNHFIQPSLYRFREGQGIVERAATKIAERLTSIKEKCERQNRDTAKICIEIGRLKGQNTRASHLFKIKVLDQDKDKDKNFALIEWTRIKPVTDWHALSDGCYLLPTNVCDWSAEDLWKAYIRLTEAENAFRIQKSDLSIRAVRV